MNKVNQNFNGDILISNNENHFKINITQIDILFESYMKGNREQEINEIKTHGGSEGIIDKLNSNPDTGLTGDLIDKHIRPKDELIRIKEFCDNVKLEAPLKSCCSHALDALQDLMLRLLIFAAIVQIVLGVIPQISEDPSKEWVEGFSILVAVVVVVSVGSITNWSKEKAFKQLNKTTEDELEVSLIRNSESRQIHPNNILVGDILKFQNGKTIPVDGIILQANNVEMDESPLTGESNRMKKFIFSECLKEAEKVISKSGKLEKIPSSLIFSGTKCVNGTGIMLVMRVGKNSEIGKIVSRISAENSSNSLEDKLDKLAGDIGKFGIGAATVTLIALLIRFGVEFNKNKNIYDEYLRLANSTNNSNIINGNNTLQTNKPEDPSLSVGQKILKIILLCIAIIVVSIPEGLPLAVTLSLAFAIAKMQKQQNLVRSMTSCETMGSANYVCTDKTGTLTKNIMEIEVFYNLDQDLSAKNKENKFVLNKNQNVCEYQTLVEQAISLNISINFEIKDGKKILTKDCNPTDKAFYDFLQNNLKIDYLTNYDKYFTDKNNVKILPFTSENKCMTTLIKHKSFNIPGFRVFIKGGPDVILPKSNFFYNKITNKAEILTDEIKNKINQTINNYAGESLRTIGIAYKDVDELTAENYDKYDSYGNLSINSSDFVLLGVVGIKDPLKEGVKEAVLNCKKSGITVIMVTGDNIVTARAIASECGIINKIENEILKKEVELEEQKIKFKFLDKIEKSNVALLGPEFSSMVGLLCDNDDCKKPTQNLSNEKNAVNGEKIELCKCFISEFEKEKILEKNPNDEFLKERKIRKEIIANMPQFQRIIKNLKVIARAQPVDKYVLVLGLKAMGNIVAVTGDGTNDAQALSKADVGFAMGKAGTDIAKDASDIILLDDNFASIITAIKYGRNIFDCIQKFIQFQLTVNLCACLLVFITACVGNETPITAIQMLWVNLIMDSLGSLALATEPPNESKLLRRKPYGRGEYIVNKTMWKHIIIQSIIQLAIMLFLYLYGPQFIREEEPYRIAEADLIYMCFGIYPGRNPDIYGYFILDGSINAWDQTNYINSGFGVNECGSYGSKSNLYSVLSAYKLSNGNSSHMTIIFNTFVIYTLFNQLNSRIIDDTFNIFLDIQKNLYFIFIEIIEFGLHILLIQFSAGVFKVSRNGLTINQWGVCIGFASVTFLVNFFTKFFMRPNNLYIYKPEEDNNNNNNNRNEEENKMLVVNKEIENFNSREKGMFNPSVIRNSGNKKESFKKHFPKN